MPTIVNIPNSSGKTPFEPCDEQYFFCTNSQISTLGPATWYIDFMPGNPAADNMQLGYTGISLMMRVILWDRANGGYYKYPDTEPLFPRERSYGLIGNVSYFGRDPVPISFSSVSEAEAHLKTLIGKGDDEQLVVARVIQTENWH